MKQLSPRQQGIFQFIRDFMEERNYPPSVRDIVQGCKLSSTSVADYNLNIIEEQGYIRRARDISRGIELVGGSRPVRVPVIGQIAAGQPIPAPQPDAWSTAYLGESVEVPRDMLHGKVNVYALKVKGASMIDALIGDGDLVLMQQADTAEDGDTVAVWLKEEQAVTLKRLYRDDGRIRLQPANKRMKPLYVAPEDVEIQGKVVGV
ncbi:MAG: transcriptional repressor LexA, partial [Dehalococcoidia bacterium]|nr:transcriptional repressor LexA [Dehalococcoidia bacterium]